MFERLKGFLATKKAQISSGVVVGMAMVSGAANAALPTEATDMFTSITTDATSAINAGWPLMLAITGGLIVMGIVKKVLGRAAS